MTGLAQVNGGMLGNGAPDFQAALDAKGALRLTVVTYRPFREGDEQNIVDLFVLAGTRTRTVEFWRWINQNNPFGSSVVQVAEIEERIIGHYSVMPVELRVNGIAHRAGLAIQAVVHKRFRDLNNLMQMAEGVWERCLEEGLEFIYGFPNDNIWKVNQVLMGWEHISDFKSWELPIRDKGIPLTCGSDGLTITRITKFDNVLDALWTDSPVARSELASITRNAEFLNWRFFQHPLEHYAVYAAESNKEAVGYVVLKVYRTKGKLFGHVVDMTTTGADASTVAQTLLSKAFEYFEWLDVDVVSCWLFPSSPYFQLFASLGFAPTGFETHFGCKAISSPVPSELLDLGNWHLTMADSDAF